MKNEPVDAPPGAMRAEDGRTVSWGVFLTVVVGVLCIGVVAGFGVSERVPQRELLWRWLLDDLNAPSTTWRTASASYG